MGFAFEFIHLDEIGGLVELVSLVVLVSSCLKVAWGRIGGVGWKLEVVDGAGVIGDWEDVIWPRRHADSRGWDGEEWSPKRRLG